MKRRPVEYRKGIWEKNSHGDKRRETTLDNLVKDNHRRGKKKVEICSKPSMQREGESLCLGRKPIPIPQKQEALTIKLRGRAATIFFMGTLRKTPSNNAGSGSSHQARARPGRSATEAPGAAPWTAAAACRPPGSPPTRSPVGGRGRKNKA